MSNHRLHAAAFALLLTLVCVYAVVAQPTHTVLLSEVAAVHVTASDGWYPGPSQMTLEYDGLGVVVVVRARLLAVMDERIYLSGIFR